MAAWSQKLKPWGIPIVLLVVGGLLFWRFGREISSTLAAALTWVGHWGWVGGILFIAIYALATVLFLPASLLTLGAGAIYGVFLGAFYVIIGATIGANLAFLIGRYLAQERVNQIMSGIPAFHAISRAIGQGGWKVAALIRLSPAFPFNILNYALGLTSISFVDNIIGTAGIIPGTLMYVYLGSLAGELAMAGTSPAPDPHTQQVQWILRILGLIATIGVTIYVTRLARQALQEMHEQNLSP
jgi:uncharacterized membrane protein YdjX (TVP38/TMEM64 family)